MTDEGDSVERPEEIVIQAPEGFPQEIAHYVNNSEEYANIDEFAEAAFRTAIELENFEEIVPDSEE